MWKKKNADQRTRRTFKTADEVLKASRAAPPLSVPATTAPPPCLAPPLVAALRNAQRAVLLRIAAARPCLRTHATSPLLWPSLLRATHTLHAVRPSPPAGI